MSKEKPRVNFRGFIPLPSLSGNPIEIRLAIDSWAITWDELKGNWRRAADNALEPTEVGPSLCVGARDDLQPLPEVGDGPFLSD